MLEKSQSAAILLIFFVAMPFLACRAQATSAIVAIDPSSTTTNPGSIFYVNVNVSNVDNLTAWQFRLYYLNSVLECNAAVEGPFLRAVGDTFFGSNITDNYNGTHGCVLAYCTLVGMNSANGSGVLATIAFSASSFGSTRLHLADVKLGDEKLPPQEIFFSASDGTVRLVGQGHNIALAQIIPNKSIVGIGYTCNVTVLVANLGNSTESCNVTLYANSSQIETRQLTLQVAEVLATSFTLDTSSYAIGNYTMNAYAWPVPAETSTSDNNLSDGQVSVRMPGDVMPVLGTLDMKDVAFVARHFGTDPYALSWDPNADINNDGKVDMKDVAVAAKNFGMRY